MVLAALAVSLARAVLHSSAEHFVSHTQLASSSPFPCRTPKSKVLLIRSWKALKSQDCLAIFDASTSKDHKLWPIISFETSASKFNGGSFKIRCCKEEYFLHTRQGCAGLFWGTVHPLWNATKYYLTISSTDPEYRSVSTRTVSNFRCLCVLGFFSGSKI